MSCSFCRPTPEMRGVNQLSISRIYSMKCSIQTTAGFTTFLLAEARRCSSYRLGAETSSTREVQLCSCAWGCSNAWLHERITMEQFLDGGTWDQRCTEDNNEMSWTSYHRCTSKCCLSTPFCFQSINQSINQSRHFNAHTNYKSYMYGWCNKVNNE